MPPSIEVSRVLMQSDYVLARESVIDHAHQVCGHGWSWQGADPSSPAAFAGLLDALCPAEMAEGSGDAGRLYLPASLPALLDPAIDRLPAARVVLRLPADCPWDPAAADRLGALRAKGAGICAPVAAIVAAPRLFPCLTHVEIDARDFARQAQAFAGKPVRLLAANVQDWDVAQQCFTHKADVMGGALAQARPKASGPRLGASQTAILQAMGLLAKNGDPRELEQILKRDPALSFRLLRYINSAGFGLGTEVQSLRHAVALLGYNTLQRWLALLLATASAGSHSALLVDVAITRGRLAELLGARLLSKKEAEDLFVVGMFSMLDRLLGMSMESLLAQVSLSDAANEALLGGEGIYGPFLGLATACESADGSARSLAESLLVPPQELNQAHLSAAAWARSMQS